MTISKTPTTLQQLVSESALQCTFVEYCDWRATQEQKFRSRFSVPNGAYLGTNKAIAAQIMRRLKKEGLSNGFPDMGFLWPSKGFHGAFMEFKTPDGRLSDEQIVWMGRILDAGYAYFVPRSLDSAIAWIEEYFREE